MADSALGSALFIPESALKKIKEADDKLKQLQRTAEQTASSVKSSFGTMQGSTSGFIGALDQIIQKLGTINNASSKMSGSLSNIGANKASKDVSQMNGVIIQASENIDRMVASQRKATNSADFSKSVSDWQNIQAQIDATNKRQQELTQSMRQYEMVQKNIRDGKGGIVYKDDKIAYAANQKEFESNKQLIASLREKQQAIIANNQALNQQIQLLNSLKNYHIESGSLDNLRSKDTLASMREYYKEQEKLSAQQEKQRKKDANAWLKNKEKEAQAAEKASRREQEASDKAAAKAEKDASRIRAAQEKAYMKDWLKQQRSAFYSNTNAVIADTNGAKTLRDHITAIKELQQARLSLNTTDKNYKQNLASVNEAIKQHSKVLKEAGVNAKSLGEQTSYIAGYLSRLMQRTAVVFSFGAAKSFVEQIAEVRGQFELSERSLEAILQNKPKADEIFNKTVELAVKSPFRIKDLVDYTRQLSAYRIESDKLYDTTKRLADVSAGLGVDMGRLILAYGQVKAAAYLRGSEVRQFTEAGVNMYGELQEYFKEVKGEAYTTAQIVDMISKRKVTFEDVEAIFQRMTDKGGTFYNMQAIQAETLQGKISNLKDAFDVMLNDIGKANEGTFKGMISSVTELLHSWKSIVNVAKIFAGFLVSIYITTKLTNGAWGQTAANIMASHKRLGVFKALMATLTGDTTKLGSTFATLGNTIKASLPLAALTAVIALVQELISVNNEYKEAMAKNTKEYYTAQVRVEEIDAEAKTNIQKALQDLVKEMNQKGFEVTIGVNLSEEEAKNQYDILLKDYQEFLDNMRAIDAKYEANKKKGWLMGDDDIETDMQEYTSSMGEFLQKGDDIRSILAQVSKESVNLTDSQKEMFKQLAAGPQKGQDLLDYYAKVAKALKEIGYIKSGWFGSKQNMVGILGGTGNNGYDWGIGANADEQLSKFTLAYETYIKNLGEVRKEAQSVFGDVSKYQDEASKKKLKLQIDNEAIKRGWGDIEKNMLYKAYSIKVNIDKNNTQKEVSWVDDFISRFFAEKKYGITLSVNEIKNTSSIDEYLDKSKEFAETAKKWKQVYENVSKATVKEYNVKGSLKDLLQGTLFADAETITKKQLMALAKSRMQENRISSKNLFGIDPFEEEKKKTHTNNKAQRDILQERVSLLKDMNAKYNELIKVESKEQALTDTRKYFKEAAQNVGWNANDILPDDASVIKRIREIGAKAKDIGKRGGYFRIAADIEFKVEGKEFDKLKDEISQNIDDAFSGLDLFKKLKSEGLSEGLIKSMFGDIATSFADVNKKIDEEFNKLTTNAYEKEFGKDKSKWSAETLARYKKDMANTASVMQQSGEEVSKDYADKQKKLAEKIKSSNINTFVELTKAYKTQLTEQLQLDKWYAEEKIKIQENVADPKLQKEYLENLTKQYNQKTSENEWKSFQNSDMYIAIFENLDQASSRVLTAMKQKLESLRTSLKDLSPEQLKQIVNQIENIDEKLVGRNPFDGLGKSFSKYISFATKRKQLEEDYAKSLKKETQLEYRKKNQGDKVNTLEAEYNKTVEIYGANSKQAQQAKRKLQIAQLELDVILQQAVAQGEITEKQAEQIRNGQKIEKTLQDQLHSIGQGFSEVSGTISSTFEMLNDWGLNIDMSDEVQEVVGGLDKIGSSLDSIDLTRPFSVIKGTIGVIGGIGKTLGGIFGWGTKDKRLQREIERHQKAIDKLKGAYDDLKEAMDNAYDIAKLSKYSDEMIKNLELQNQNLQSMIAAEKEKKDTDNSKIEEWQKQIEANNKAIKEAEETLTEQLGGFGSEANYKSAAEAFAEAWIDAFNEGSDALDALNKKFDEYIKNLIVKQATVRLVGKMIKPVLKAIDEAVAEGSEGGNNGLEITSSELKKISDLWGKISPNINDGLKSIVETLGYKPGANSNLSALQQGIQSVSEATAQALESIINSIRYFVAQQQSDIAAIRNILEARLGAVTAQGESGGSSNQMIALMEQQAGYLHEICDNWSSVLKGGHKQGGKGIKVFMS